MKMPGKPSKASKKSKKDSVKKAQPRAKQRHTRVTHGKSTKVTQVRDDDVDVLIKASTGAPTARFATGELGWCEDVVWCTHAVKHGALMAFQDRIKEAVVNFTTGVTKNTYGCYTKH